MTGRRNWTATGPAGGALETMTSMVAIRSAASVTVRSAVPGAMAVNAPDGSTVTTPASPVVQVTEPTVVGAPVESKSVATAVPVEPGASWRPAGPAASTPGSEGGST